jgi:uncharacterized integral membrane protein
MIRLIFTILVIFALLGFAYTNQAQNASLYLFWGVHTEPIAVYLIVIGSFLLGAVFAALMTFPGWLKLKLDRRRQSKRIAQLETDLDRIRTEALKAPGPPFHPSSREELQDEI